MLQQPVFQQEKTESQDVQQMVLCPVGVVYNTQMFVPQGDQMQPNQIIINTQNPPPWIQNRPQNQIIYVQHVPTNFIPQQQQHIDQNQMYIQNYAYQNVPQMLYQQDQLRQIQMVPNIIPNVQTNVGNVNQRVVTANVGQIANPINEVQNQVPTETFTNQMFTDVKQQQMLNHNRPFQMTQDVRIPMPQTVPTVPNISHGNRLPQYNQSVQYRQIQPHVAQNIMPNVEANVGANINQRITSTNAGSIHNTDTKIYNTQSYITNPAIAKTQPIYRQILPRPNVPNPQIVPVIPNQSQTLTNVPNVLYMNNIPRKINPNLISNVPLPNYVKLDGSTQQFNRKRKSESPDDIQRKVLVPNQKNVPITIPAHKVPSLEIGVNTSPVHKINKAVTNSIQLIPISAQNTSIKEELAKPVRSSMNIESQMLKMAPITDVIQTSTPSDNDKEKLIRNTVFTQARGRLLSDKERIPENKEEMKASVDKISQENNKTNETDKIAQNITNESISLDVCDKTKEVKEINEKNEDTECDIKFKDNRDFVLTHVLDGYVIQESNVAFPIRKPLKEKVIHVNSDIEPKTETKDFKDEETVANKKDILHLAGLHLKEKTDLENSEIDKDNPFRSLETNTVKSWTVNQLATYLSKFGWEETVSTFQEHEIDGESLFLVSKAQLLTIGISELHADAICNYIKS